MRHNFVMQFLAAIVTTGLLFSFGCTKDDGARPDDGLSIDQRGPSSTNGNAVSTPLIGLTADNELVFLMSGPPVSETGMVRVTGMRDGEYLLAIDTRPRTKELFGVTSESMLYVIDPNTGEALPISTSPFVPKIDGSMVGFDFNPTDDLLRVVTDQGQSLRISPLTGAVVGVDVSLNSNVVAINSIAYSNTIPGARSTLFDIDANEGNLYMQSNPNGGSLQLVGPTGFLFSGEGGFEITGTNTAFAIQYGMSRSSAGIGSTPLYDDPRVTMHRLLTISLRNGAATSNGKVRPMIGLAAR